MTHFSDIFFTDHTRLWKLISFRCLVLHFLPFRLVQELCWLLYQTQPLSYKYYPSQENFTAETLDVHGANKSNLKLIKKFSYCNVSWGCHLLTPSWHPLKTVINYIYLPRVGGGGFRSSTYSLGASLELAAKMPEASEHFAILGNKKEICLCISKKNDTIKMMDNLLY